MLVDLEDVVTRALDRAGHHVERRVVLEGVTGEVYAQDFHVTGPRETLVWLHPDGPADADVVGRVLDATRDVGLDAALLVAPHGVVTDVELPDRVIAWDVQDLERMLDVDLPWAIHPAAIERASAPLDRVYNRMPAGRPEAPELRPDLEDELREALESAEALTSAADGILEMGPVTDQDTADALEGFSRILEELDDEKEEDRDLPFEPSKLPELPARDGDELPDPADGSGAAGDEDDDPEPLTDEGFLDRLLDVDEEPTPTDISDALPGTDADEDAEVRDLVKPVIAAEQASNLVAGMVHGSMRTDLTHVPFYLYTYSMKLEDETNGHRENGRVWVHTGTLEVQEVPEDVVFETGEIDHPAQREDKAREKARRMLLAEHVRKTRVIADDEHVTLIEEEDVHPDPDSLDITLEGTVGKPHWRVAGDNGDVLVDAIVGEIVESNLRDDDHDGDVMVV